MRSGFLHQVLVFIGLFGFWVVLSGKLDAVHLVMGVVSAAFVTLLSASQLFSRTDGTEDKMWLSFMPWLKLFAYLPWLAVEIIKSNINVLRLVLGPIDRLQPRVVRFRPNLVSEVSRISLANSITLTPGTVTLDVTPEGEFVVHALDPVSADGLLEGTMERKVAAVFSEGEDE